MDPITIFTIRCVAAFINVVVRPMLKAGDALYQLSRPVDPHHPPANQNNDGIEVVIIPHQLSRQTFLRSLIKMCHAIGLSTTPYEVYPGIPNARFQQSRLREFIDGTWVHQPSTKHIYFIGEGDGGALAIRVIRETLTARGREHVSFGLVTLGTAYNPKNALPAGHAVPHLCITRKKDIVTPPDVGYHPGSTEKTFDVHRVELLDHPDILECIQQFLQDAMAGKHQPAPPPNSIAA